MGAPPHLVLPDPSQQRPSLPSPAFSPHSCPTSSSLSSSDCSSSSFSQSFPPHGDFAPNFLKQEQQQQRKHNAVLEKTVRQKNRAKLKQITKSSSAEPLREGKIVSSSTQGISMCKACSRSAGALAADCAAVSCCPCAVFSLLSLVLIELPSSLARRMVTRLQKWLCMKDAISKRSSRGGESSHSVFTPTWSYRGASEVKPGASIIQFSTQSLVEHFEAEHVGFGCLSRERE